MACSSSSRVLQLLALIWVSTTVESKLADRSRIVKSRQDSGKNSRFHDNGRPIEGSSYRSTRNDVDRDLAARDEAETKKAKNNNSKKAQRKPAPWKMDLNEEKPKGDVQMFRGRDLQQQEPEEESLEDFERKLSSQLTGCCYNYKAYGADDLCYMYGQDCESGETPSHDSGDDSCTVDGLSFIGVSFSVNTASGNPYSYQLCDQFPMENIIDRGYDYVMSLDEDGWLVGAGYKTFDYSGKMPYIDSSHTEILRIGNLDPSTGGTSIDQVYAAMSSVSFPPFSIFPEYLKGGGGQNSGDDSDGSVPSSDVTLIVSVVESYDDNDSYSTYEQFLDDMLTAFYDQDGGSCMDDHDTDPHVSMSRGVKYWSAYHEKQYMYQANLEVAVWQAMYPYGTAIGSAGYAAFPPGHGGTKQHVGYGNLYFFFDRANITKAFSPNRDLTSSESYYAKLYMKTDVSQYYSSTTSINFDYSGSQDDGDGCSYEHNAYGWNAKMAMHDMTDGWDLPPSCLQEGETFFGIPLSRASESKLQSSASFQEQFDFEYLTDRNNTYVTSFGTNHGWLVGEQLGNAAGSIVDKDTAHIPVFYTGTTNPNMGGMSLGQMIKVAQNVDFGTLYIKPAFVFVDSDGHVKLQFEVDTSSALAYLYDTLCKELGIAWNYESPTNNVGAYTNCAMHAAGDRASYGCGPDGTNQGGFCPQMTLAYSPRFDSEDSAASYLARSNNYVDYWRSLYPSGVAVGTSKFCPSGGCLALFLNRIDVYEVFKPDLGGSWVEYNGASMPPTFSPAPTFTGGCDDPHNSHLDKCFRKHYKPKASAVAWDALGGIGQFSVMLVVFMAVTLSVSIFLARARKKRRRGESYLGFFFRDLSRKRRKKRRKGKDGNDLEEDMLPETTSSRRAKSNKRGGTSRSHSKSTRSKSRSKSGLKSRDGSRSRALRPAPLEPGIVTGQKSQSRGRSGSRSRAKDDKSEASQGTERRGVFDLTVSSPPEDDGDKRQQLV